MSSLLNSNDIYYKTGVFARHFDTFSTGNFIVIYKEPLKTVINNPTTYYGYGTSSQESNVIYTPVSGVFPFMRVYDKNPTINNKVDIQSLTFPNKVKIKVKNDAREFIKNGKNESFELDGLVFNGILEETVQNYLGLKYYYFTLISTL